MSEWTDRLIDEHAELTKKLHRLAIFKNGATWANWNAKKRARLARQEFHMTAYAKILSDRIKASQPD